MLEYEKNVLKGSTHMRKVYTVEQYQSVHNSFYFSLNDNHYGIQIEPAGQVIVDSDQFAFIYLVEEGEEYSYISFPQELWSALVDVIRSEQNPYLKIADQTIELVNFNDELQTLLFNIEGNDNYGNKFVQAVEKAFAQVLKDDTVE